MRNRRKPQMLGAVTGPGRVEYFLPSSVADVIGGKGNYAFCMKDVEYLVPKIRQQAEYEAAVARRSAEEEVRVKNLLNYGYDEKLIEKEAKKRATRTKKRMKAGNAFADLAAEIEKDVSRLRKNGVKGAIPVCFNRTTGKRGGGLERYFRRANATHERFHADARRVEIEAGVESFECYKDVDRLVEPFIGGTPLRYYSLRHFANMKSKLATEELLARVEEVRKACETKKGKKQDDCNPTVATIVSGMDKEESRAFAKLAMGIEKNYGTPLNVVRAAVRSCKVK